MKKHPEKQPVLFVGHGSPMNAVEDNDFTQALKDLGKTLPPPRAILVVSAHWETQGTFVTGMEHPKTIHDFYGFPPELFQVQYPAPGDPHLANTLITRVPGVQIDFTDWGLDHGAWSVLIHLFPSAKIPVLQISLDRNQDARFHFELGKKLRPLRHEGVLLLGSGNIVHNLRTLDWDPQATPHPWALEFDQWVADRLIARNFLPLVEEPRTHSAGQLSIPTWEHYLPFLTVLGASDETDNFIFDYEGIQNASISMRSVRFVPQE